MHEITRCFAACLTHLSISSAVARVTRTRTSCCIVLAHFPGKVSNRLTNIVAIERDVLREVYNFSYRSKATVIDILQIRCWYHLCRV